MEGEQEEEKGGGGLFGRIALKKGFLDQDELAQGLRLQEELRALGVRLPLGEALVRADLLEEEQVETILRLQQLNEGARRDRLFGRVAVKNELIGVGQLEEAFAEVRREGHRRPLQAVLVERGWIEPSVGRAIRLAIERDLLGSDVAGRKQTTTTRLARRIRVDAEEDAEPDVDTEIDRRVQDVIYAAVALRDGLVLVPELERALREQDMLPERPTLERVLRARGVLSEGEARSVGEAVQSARAQRLTIPGYTITDMCGQGVTSLVLRARHDLMDREVAIKLFRPEHMEGSDQEAFMEEARAVAKLLHPNVVQLFEVGRVHRRIFFVMELIDGATLLERIKRAEDGLGELEVLRVARDVTRALEAIDAAGLVHRDVKPQNILITRSGQAKLTDLGLALDVEGISQEPGGELICGTPLTMAPEQINGDPVDIRTDLYGLGATVFYALAGKPPFWGENPLAIMLNHLTQDVPSLKAQRPDLSEGTVDLVHRLLCKQPRERPTSPTEVLAVLDELIEEEQPLDPGSSDVHFDPDSGF